MKTGEVVECLNIATEPGEQFVVRGEDLVQYGENAVATWHTHPGGDSNLSMEDYQGFANYPELRHYIVGFDGIRGYEVQEDDTIIQTEIEEDNLAREAEEADQ